MDRLYEEKKEREMNKSSREKEEDFINKRIKRLSDFEKEIILEEIR